MQLGSCPASLSLQDAPSGVVGSGRRESGSRGRPSSSSSVLWAGVDSVSAHSPLAETRGIRKGTSIIRPESQGPGVLGGPQRNYAQVATGFTAAVLPCALEQPGAQRVVSGAVGSGVYLPVEGSHLSSAVNHESCVFGS